MGCLGIDWSGHELAWASAGQGTGCPDHVTTDHVFAGYGLGMVWAVHGLCQARAGHRNVLYLSRNGHGLGISCK
jgi:hypothetical protein